MMAFSAMFLPLSVSAQTINLGVGILQITPSDATAAAGTSVNVIGTIETRNGAYQIVFNSAVVASGQADGYYVDKNFTVPSLGSGTYKLILRDTAANIDSETVSFTIAGGYSITSTPASVQEGESVTLTASVSGAKAGTSYTAKIDVSLPGSGTTYSKTVTLGTANSNGVASAQVTFPDSSFDPSDSHTVYVGTYTVSFNGSLAQTQIQVNFLDSTTYHKGETINIHAIGYEANQAATLKISSKSGEIIDTKSVTASADGVISMNWVIPASIAISDYTVKIVPEGTQKKVQDSQVFTIAGYTVKIQTINLANDKVPNITLQVIDPSNTMYNSTSDVNGTATFRLEKGTHAVLALWNGVNVGAENITVDQDETFTMHLQLTNLKVTVKDANGVTMPFVNLDIQYKYGSGKTGSASGQTGPSGSFILNSAFVGASYTIDASMYNQVFNSGNNSIGNPPAVASSEVLIICPSETITLNVLGYNQEAIPNARIELVEVSNGLFYSITTDANGAAYTQATFGMYRVRVYKDNILVNETSLEVFGESQSQIRCSLYGIQVSVSVVDMFGSPISNAKVTLNGLGTMSALTQSDGKAVFSNIIGGSMQVVAQATETPTAYQAVTVTVNEPTTVQIKMDKFVALGSMMIPASLFIAVIIIILAAILFFVVEFVRLRRVKHGTEQ